MSEAGEGLVIKFTKQYSETAHIVLADLMHAPALRGVYELPGGWKMIVMERSQLTQLNRLILDDASKTIESEVRRVAKELHKADLVHGDIRQVNILVDEKSLHSSSGVSIHFIDFDWAGPAGKARYPLDINTKTIQRPHGVMGGIRLKSLMTWQWSTCCTLRPKRTIAPLHPLTQRRTPYL